MLNELTLWCAAVCVGSLLLAQPGIADDSYRKLNRPHAGAISLSGEWEFRLDPDSVGKDEGWFTEKVVFKDSIRVPGCWDAQGKGIPGVITTLPYADDPDPHVRTISAYNGDAWYRRTFRVPEGWRGRVIWLNIGGVNDRATIWVNGHPAGSHDGYCTGFELDVTDLVKYDEPNVCAVLVSNKLRPEGGLEGCLDFLADWGGIYRDVWLDSTGHAWIENLRILPQLSSSSARVQAVIGGKTDVDAKIIFEVFSKGDRVAGKEIKARQGSVEAVIPIANAKLWSPDSPHMYELRARLVADEEVQDSVCERFGMREIRVEGKRILLNGSPIFLRGYGDDCIYPITVSPPADKEHYLKELRRARSYGFNFARHHTWTPLPEHLDAADEVGILVQAELPTGAHPFHHPSKFLESLWRDELRRIIETNANHPSWIILSMGNELGDALNDPEVQRVYSGLTHIAREMDPTRLVIITSGSTTELPPEEPFYSRGIYGIEPLRSRYQDIAGWIAGHDRPYVWHEMGYYASYPNPAVRSKYKGGAIPFWLDEAVRVAKEKGLEERLPTYVRNSVRLQEICLKWLMELARKCPDLAGFEWWTFKDNSWPMEGIVDDFTDPKIGMDADAIRRINADAVLLLDEVPRTARAGDTLAVKALLSNYSNRGFEDAVLDWALLSGKRAIARGTLPTVNIGHYGLSELGEFEIPIPRVNSPEKLLLRLTLKDERREVENEWPVWVFPRPGRFPADVAVYDPFSRLKSLPFNARRTDSAPEGRILISTALDPSVIAFAEKGGRVLLISRKDLTGLPERICKLESPDIPYSLYFAPTYWGAPYAPGGGNLGTVITDHPALGSFPHEGFCDLQFLELLYGVNRADLDSLPAKVEPIIRSITDWRIGANAGYLYEVRVGKGGLLVTTLNFEQTLAGGRPEAEWLSWELLSYLASDSFHPTTDLNAEYLRSIRPSNS